MRFPLHRTLKKKFQKCKFISKRTFNQTIPNFTKWLCNRSCNPKTLNIKSSEAEVICTLVKTEIEVD